MMMEIVKIQSKILLYFAIICVLGILSLCIPTFYWADDYNLMYTLREKGILYQCIDGYNNWDGRMFSLPALVQLFSLKNLPIEMVTLLWSMCFMLSGMFIFYILAFELQFNIENKTHKFLIICILAIISWLGAVAHFAQTIYWGTGGFYSFTLLLGALWIWMFLKIQHQNTGTFQKISFLLFSIVVGGCTQNLTVALLTLTIIYLINNKLNNISSKTLFHFCVLLSLLGGLSVIMLAPGNFVRMEAAGVGDFSEILFITILQNFGLGLVRYFYYSIVAIFLSVLVSFGIFHLLHKNVRFLQFPKMNFPKTKESLGAFLLNIKWLLMAISTLMPFVFMPSLIAKRTVIFFVFFMVLFVFSLIFKTLQKSHTFTTETQKITLSFKTYVPILIILFSTLLFTLYNFKKGLELKKLISERELLLKKRKGKTVHVKLIDPKLASPCFQFADFPTEPTETSAFIKIGQELYFDVKIVVEK